MNITIDGQIVEITSDDKNIVDVADRNKIGLPAPCYRVKQSKGCCHACIIDINGEQKYACNTVPKDGLNIVIDRADLKALRKERLLEYKKSIENGKPCECNTSSSYNCCG